MAKGIPMRVPVNMYNYIRERAVKKETSMRIETSRFFEKFQRLKALEDKLKDKKVLVFK